MNPVRRSKTRIPVWLYPSTLEVIDRAAETVNCKRPQRVSGTRSTVLCRIYFRTGCHGVSPAPHSPKSCGAIVRDTENRICRLLFKLAVELDMVMNLLAAAMEIPEARLRELRVR